LLPAAFLFLAYFESFYSASGLSATSWLIAVLSVCTSSAGEAAFYFFSLGLRSALTLLGRASAGASA
jgi:hypothetical protein